MGVATIATDSEGVREIITDHRTGLLVPPRSAEAIAGAVVELYRDPALRHAFASRGVAYARTAYDNDAQYRKFEKALRGAMRRRIEDGRWKIEDGRWTVMIAPWSSIFHSSRSRSRGFD
jgi:glycosyltransferase involved in cell wall biosynthesis